MSGFTALGEKARKRSKETVAYALPVKSTWSTHSKATTSATKMHPDSLPGPLSQCRGLMVCQTKSEKLTYLNSIAILVEAKLDFEKGE